MSKLTFDTGLVTYDLNEACQVSFNPTDSAFVKRLFDAFDELEKKRDFYKSALEAVSDDAEYFRISDEMDKDMRGIIDGLFGVPVCDKLLGSMNVYALADGLPVWANLMLTVMDEVDKAFADQKELTDPRLEKYSAKYRNRKKK